MSDIIISPLGSNSTSVLRGAYGKALAGDRVIYRDGIFNCEDLTTKDAAIRVPDGVISMAEHPRMAEIRRGDNQIAYSILANSNFDKVDGVNRRQLYKGLRFNGNRTGQTEDWHLGLLEHRHCLAFIGLKNVYQEDGVEGCEFVELCGDGAIMSQTYDGPTRTGWTTGIRYADNYFGGKKQNRNGISFISARDCNVEGSNIFEECGRPDMPGAVCYEPDVDGDVVLHCDTSGIFRRNIHDVTFIAQWPKTQIIECGGNIKTDHPIPWQSLFVTAERGGEAMRVFMASTPWDK